jgi:hypothetical protein
LHSLFKLFARDGTIAVLVEFLRAIRQAPAEFVAGQFAVLILVASVKDCGRIKATSATSRATTPSAKASRPATSAGALHSGSVLFGGDSSIAVRVQLLKPIRQAAT